MKTAFCGTMESNDCLITVKHHDHIEIVIESIVFDQFGDQIETVIKQTLSEMNIRGLFVHVKDKGALDYAIKARLMTAIRRLEESHA
jgi:citrate lyase subunit gamma (acyl carrier protein)